MENKMTFKQYRSMDLLILSVVFAVCETLVVKASTKWFPGQPYTVSLAPALSALMYMRWGVYGVPYSFLTGFVYCLASGGSPEHYAVYMVGNLLSAAVLLMRKKMGHRAIRESVYASAVFALLVALLMQAGRAVVVLLLGSGVMSALRIMATDFLSGVFGGVLVYVARKQDGLFEDQKSYLLRINSEEEA